MIYHGDNGITYEIPCRCPYSCWWHGASLEEVNRILDGRQPMREEIADLERWWRL